ncbi:MAG TPA: hypothetical protein VGS05_17850 [Candidatus Sulfotelmatobacter sp.]|nr:hypothetical protein [Candidatus Sulfotelmatobacter sp.]
MTQIIVSVAIGSLLLGIAVYWFLQADASPKVHLSDAREALGCLQSTFLPVSVVDRVLDYNDFVFVRRQKEPGILRTLETERRAIAMYWVRHTRQQMRLLMSFYVKSARRSSGLSAALELKLALNYLVFLAACNAFLGLIWLRGPFHAQKVARRTRTVAARFCAVSEKVVALTESRAELREASGQQWPAG